MQPWLRTPNWQSYKVKGQAIYSPGFALLSLLGRALNSVQDQVLRHVKFTMKNVKNQSSPVEQEIPNIPPHHAQSTPGAFCNDGTWNLRRC